MLYSILRENPLAKLVSDPWFRAGVTIQVGLCAFHSPVFCGTRSAGSARVLCGAGGLAPRAGGAQGCRGLSICGGLDPPPQAYFYLSLGLDRSRQPPLAAVHATFRGLLIIEWLLLVSIAVHDKVVIWIFFHTYVVKCLYMDCLPFNMEAFVVFNLPHLRTVLF